ncbi:hypothetical protein [Aurantimonas sp. Leaf443]|uniref:hypothetical protein n=1 Tax=Aurantimonas sp. Leaf443 TaxID=1736378 RepID=UPI0006F5EF73|nr:hypothetical protein [Aurantimonas sp. Leaf443]KQT85357.1 hypothetical protein ASG48_08935 [Aurantimonas sp. Leaf443]
MKPLWLTLMAATLAFSPASLAFAQGTAAPAATEADDDDDDAAAVEIESEASPMAPAEMPGAGMPASALNGDQLGLPKLSRSSQDIPPLVLGTDENDFAVNRRHFVLRAGQAYRWRISSQGGVEYKLHAPQFYRDVWFNQLVISDLEVHMAGPPAWLEYDAKGTIQVQFNTIRPGNYKWYVEGLEGGQAMEGTITVVP